MKFEARLYDYVIKTENFGTFEMFSWEIKSARSLIIVRQVKFRVKVEGASQRKIISSSKRFLQWLEKEDII